MEKEHTHIVLFDTFVAIVLPDSGLTRAYHLLLGDLIGCPKVASQVTIHIAISKKKCEEDDG